MVSGKWFKGVPTFQEFGHEQLNPVLFLFISSFNKVTFVSTKFISYFQVVVFCMLVVGGFAMHESVNKPKVDKINCQSSFLFNHLS